MRSLTIEHGRLVLRSPYDRDLFRDLRRVPMYRVRPDGAWEFAVACRAHVIHIAETHGIDISSDVRIPPSTLDDKIEHVAASRALDAEFTVDGLALDLHPFQRAGVSYAADRRRCIIADEMGLGKTPQALATLQARQAFPAAILVPSSIKINWARETARWLPHLRVGVLYGVPSNRQAAEIAARLRVIGRPSRHRIPAAAAVKIEPGAPDRVARMLSELDVIIANYDIVGPITPTRAETKRRAVLEHGWTPVLLAAGLRAVVADESQMIMHKHSLRSRAARQLSWSLEADDDVVLALSGSAVLNRRVELAAQLDFIGRLHEFGGYEGLADVVDLAARVRSRCMVRRLKRHVAPELPARLHVPVILDREALDPVVMREYDRAEADTLEYLADQARRIAAELGEDPESAAVETVMRLSGNEALVRINLLRKLAMQAKLPAAERRIRGFQEAGNKLLVFGNHLEGLDRFAADFHAPLIKGGVPTERRMQIVDQFQADPDVWVVFLQIMAGGVGLTMTAASNVLFLEFAWSPLIHDQAIDRCYGRLNDMHGATGWYLVAEGTIDEWIMDLLTLKRIECDDALDGDMSDDVIERTSVFGDLVVRMTRRALAARRAA